MQSDGSKRIGREAATGRFLPLQNRTSGPVTGSFGMPNGDKVHFVRRDIFDYAVGSDQPYPPKK
jgi:hypothetical protein